jgi:hypothetical protein
MQTLPSTMQDDGVEVSKQLFSQTFLPLAQSALLSSRSVPTLLKAELKITESCLLPLAISIR